MCAVHTRLGQCVCRCCFSVSSSITLYLTFLRQSLSGTSVCCFGDTGPMDLPVCPFPSVLVTQVCVAVPGFLHGSWGYELMTSCL